MLCFKDRKEGGERSSGDTKGNVIVQYSKRLLTIKQKMECFDAWTANKNLPSNLLQVVMLRIVKVLFYFSQAVYHNAVSAVKCFNTKVVWKGMWRATGRVLWMIILLTLLLLKQQTRLCQIKLLKNWVVKLEWFKS